MPYTEEEIKKYLNILHNYKVEESEGVKKSKVASCLGCKNTESFFIDFGQKICYNCGMVNGHVLGFYDVKDYDRVHYRKKSIYHRKYYYDKKVNKISKLINLTYEQTCELYNRLLKIDNYIMENINKQYFRKRMINITYVIKKILDEMGCEKYKSLELKISPKTLETYDSWWETYKELLK